MNTDPLSGPTIQNLKFKIEFSALAGCTALKLDSIVTDGYRRYMMDTGDIVTDGYRRYSYRWIQEIYLQMDTGDIVTDGYKRYSY